MDLLQYLSILRRHFPIVLLTVFVTVATALGLTLLTEPKYRASAVLRLEVKAISPDAVRSDTVTFIERLENTYARIAKSDAVVGEAARELGFESSPPVEVESIPNTELLTITAESTDAEPSAQLANVVARRLIGRVAELNEAPVRELNRRFERRIANLVAEIAAEQQTYNTLQTTGKNDAETQSRLLELETSIEAKQRALADVGRQRQEERLAADRRAYALTVVDRAAAPEDPASPRPLLSLVVGLLLGLIAGVGLAFLYENLNPTFGSPEEIEETASDILRDKDNLVLGHIPRHARGGAIADPDGAFHRLRMAVFGTNGRVTFRSLLITSAHDGEGKTSVVANLGASLARSGRRVLLVDADLRHPQLHTELEVPNEVGLTDVLRGEATLADAVQATTIPGLHVLTSGSAVDDPAALLDRSDLVGFRKGLSRGFDATLMDAPPILSASDALVLSRAADAVVLVVHPSRRTGPGSLRTAVTELRRLNSSFAGVVVNGVKDPSARMRDGAGRPAEGR